MFSHVLWPNFIHVDCTLRIPSLTRSPVRVAYSSAFLFHCRILILGSGDVNVGSSIQEVCHIPSCSCSQEGLPCLIAVSVFSGSYISTRFIFAKQRLQCVRLICKFPIFNGQSGFSEILIHVVFNFLESFIKWFAECSHCNQEGPFPTKKTCPVSMIWRHLQLTLRIDQTCCCCCRLWCRLLCRRHSTAAQVNWISSARFLSFRPQTFRRV